jgi:transcriptional regulator with XRE-family HTH domain
MKRRRVTPEYKDAAIKLGRQLRSLREKHNLTQMALSKIIGVPQTTVSSWENGVTIPDSFELFRLTEVFDVDILSFKPDFNLSYENQNQEKTDDIKGKIEALEKVVYQIAAKMGVKSTE